MDLESLKPILSSTRLRSVLESKKLAQLGDFLANFVYSAVKIGIMDINGSVHVWDVSLRKAMEHSQLRSALGKKVKPDKVADSAEALVAFAYFNSLLTLEEMIDILAESLLNQDLSSPKKEKEACSLAFSDLLTRIVDIAIDQGKLKKIES